MFGRTTKHHKMSAVSTNIAPFIFILLFSSLTHYIFVILFNSYNFLIFASDCFTEFFIILISFAGQMSCNNCFIITAPFTLTNFLFFSMFLFVFCSV